MCTVQEYSSSIQYSVAMQSLTYHLFTALTVTLICKYSLSPCPYNYCSHSSLISHLSCTLVLSLQQVSCASIRQKRSLGALRLGKRLEHHVKIAVPNNAATEHSHYKYTLAKDSESNHDHQLSAPLRLLPQLIELAMRLHLTSNPPVDTGAEHGEHRPQPVISG